MDPTNSPLLAGLARRLEFLAARSGVIAENIANADTPGYAARDLKPQKFANHLAPAMRVSDPRHMTRANGAASPPRAEASPDPDVSLNGNRVSIETQMMKLSQTRQDYQLVSSVYRKAVDMIRLAARGGR
ncbi:MAG: flagellar basal body protein [Pseudomonadota bacterium]|nr:flagellar basal body protein [Pseudomonadota bacterium]